MTIEIPIREEFVDPNGGFPNYDCYDANQRTQLPLQRHVDIRSFLNDTTDLITIPNPFLNIDTLSQAVLDAMTMQQLEGTRTVRSGEQWTTGVVAKQAGINNWHGITLTCVAGANVTQSVITYTPNPYVSTTAIKTVDISGLASTDFVTVALPSFPLPSVTLASCFLTLTSEPTGAFSGPTSVAVPFTSTTVALINGNSELRLPISAFSGVDLSKITGVKITIQATGNCTVKAIAIRAVAATWEYAPIDTNTLYHYACNPPTLTGAASAASAFPAATAPITPSEWPILFRSSTPPGQADPKPINAKMSLAFNSGSLVAAAGASKSIVALYFRELGLDENQQLDLDVTYTQDDLNNYGTRLITNGGTTIWTPNLLPGAKVQPDFGRALYDPRTQASLDAQQQLALDQDTQFILERIQDFLSAAYLEVKLQFSSGSAPSLTIFDQSGTGYSFAPTIVANTNYLLMVDLAGASMRARIYNSDTVGTVGTLAFDTTAIIDDTFIKRRPGRVGWYARLLDGDALVTNVRPRATDFGQYISLPFYSDTPVSGAQLYAHASPDQELITSLTGSQWGGTTVLDSSKSNSGHAFRVVNDGTSALQGAQTNSMYLDEFAETQIEFDLNFPAAAINSGVGITPFLLGEFGRVLPLSMGFIEGDRWQHIKITLAPYTDLFQTGLYQLVLLQTASAARTTWYIDNLSCTTRVIAWDARSKAMDAWSMSDPDWIPFLDLDNNPDGSVVFPSFGDGMQIRARAIRQTAEITDVRATPKYAQLGNIVWGDQASTLQSTLVSLPTVGVISGNTVNFSGAATVSSDPVIAFIWSFGDGAYDFGPNPVHTYANSGTYTVTLTVVDSKNQRKSATAPVTV